MNDDFDRMASLGFNEELLACGRARFLAECDQSVVASISYGVLFVMAFWSGPARIAFATLKRVMAEVDPQGRLELVVVDTDGCADLYDLPEFRNQLAGAGETAWVKAGHIVSTATRPTLKAFKSNTADLLTK